MLENNQNSECNYAEQIVSLLYDEISGAEKSGFESHLKTCAECAAELADFSALRFSINEWRNDEFENLAAPVIEIPEIKGVSAESNSWLNSIRQFFALHSVGFSAAALAAILVVFGFFWFSNNPAVNEIAENRSVKTPAIETTAIPEKNLVAKTDETEATKEISVSSPEPETQMNNSRSATNAVKITDRKNSGSIQNSKVNKTMPVVKSNKQNEKAAPKKANVENMPTLAVDEYEDKSLRLSDIFDEVSLK